MDLPSVVLTDIYPQSHHSRPSKRSEDEVSIPFPCFQNLLTKREMGMKKGREEATLGTGEERQSFGGSFCVCGSGDRLCSPGLPWGGGHSKVTSMYAVSLALLLYLSCSPSPDASLILDTKHYGSQRKERGQKEPSAGYPRRD